ncbi:MAG TPA: ATP-binding cassette domain-containing protein, partial [Saprospiraceae bacterium]|nr:ATP-binding cassette domain-containing protein [Saprospiraceae bacterium]
MNDLNTQNVIELEHLSRVYIMGDQRLYALRDISFKVNRNEYVALMGPSGSGKSTLMNILGCLDTPTSGKYLLNDHDVSHMEDKELAHVRNKEIGFVFQTFNLLPRVSALENVAVPLIYAGVSRKERLERAKV